MSLVRCPGCKTTLFVNGTGKNVACPQCGVTLHIPLPQAKAPPVTLRRARDEPKPAAIARRMSSRSAVWLLLFIFGGFVIAAMLVLVIGISLRRTVQEQPIAANGPAANEPAGKDLSRHPWWRRAMTANEIDGMVASVAGLQALNRFEHSCTFCVMSDGRTFHDELPIGRRDDGPIVPGFDRTFAHLQGGDQRVIIQFLPGPLGSPALSRPEARSLLQKMLDEAYASEEQWKKTGKGNALLDQLENMQPGFQGLPEQAPPAKVEFPGLAGQKRP